MIIIIEEEHLKQILSEIVFAYYGGSQPVDDEIINRIKRETNAVPT